MKKVLLIGKLNSTTKEIGNYLSGHYSVKVCSENEKIIEGMLQAERPDLLIEVFSGSAVFARGMFQFLLPYKLPLLGIGSSSDEAELFINGLLTGSGVRFLSRPVTPETILSCVRILTGEEDEQEEVDSGMTDLYGMESASILLVDDSPAFLRAMQAILSTKYRVSFASSAVQAIVSIAKDRPDLILLDYEMPVCDGKMVLQMLRSEEDMKDIPVVFLTGISDSKHVSDVLSLGPEGYLLKPCKAERVFAVIDKVLSKDKPLYT